MKNNTDNKYYKYIFRAASVLIWLIIWHLTAGVIDKEIFLPAPERVMEVLCKTLLADSHFWTSVTSSLYHIGLGFFAGAACGIILAVLSYFCSFIRAFLWFPIKVLKSVPVASFVILVLLWADSEDLSVIIPAVVVLPTLYINTMTGFEQTDKKLIEMATLFRASSIKKCEYIYIPSLLPYILSAASLAIGMAWKSGVAAEIIGLSKNSIGNELYKAKLYLMTPELFAWTIVIVLLSIFCETIIKLTLKFIERRKM